MATAQWGNAATIAFNFESGVGSQLSTLTSSNLWSLGTEGPDFRVTKSTDDATVLRNDFIAGGLTTKFALTGNFLITVHFTHFQFPPAGPDSRALNESVLGVSGNTNSEVFLVLRFRFGANNQIEAFGGAGVPIGVRDSSLSNGRYQIERVGETLTGRFAEGGSEVFTTLGSSGGYVSSQFLVSLNAVQGFNASGVPRSSTALDIAFDNLTIQADGFVVTTPPQIRTASLVGNDLVISGTGGIEGNDYFVLTSVNVDLPFALWGRVATNSFGADGTFSFTNAVALDMPQRFFLI